MVDFGRRATDQGKEDPIIMLTRIDERVKSLDEKFEDFKKNFDEQKRSFGEHVKEDKIAFDGLNKLVARASGAFACVVLIIGWFIALRK